MFRYKSDQGVLARGTAFWVLTGFAALAAQRFFYEIQGWRVLSGWMMRNLTARVPILGFPLRPAFLLALGAFGVLAYVAWRVVNLPRAADLLIDTEAEVRKITWPSIDDSRKASYVVIGCVMFMLVFLGVVDLALQWIFRTLIYA